MVKLKRPPVSILNGTKGWGIRFIGTTLKFGFLKGKYKSLLYYAPIFFEDI